MKFTYPSGSRPLQGYTIKRGIGRGGFGEVYYATSDAGKEVALKLIRRNLEVELRGVTQCINLKHPNLLGLFDIKEDEHEDSWVVMEYVDGQSLEDIIARHPRGLPIEEALNWFHGVASGVAYLHDKGIVHRDLKPGNIFSDVGVVKIGDYGLSKFISASRRSGQTESVGTVHYMAPEIANGRYGKEIDIYALGVILYEILTGHVPFEGESVGEVLMKHLTAEPDLSVLDEPYRGIVARCLTKDPDERIHSVGDIIAALPGAGQAAPVGGQAAGFATPPHREEKPAAANGSPHRGGQAKPVPVAELVVNDDPVIRGIRDAWRQLVNAWNDANFNTPTKVILIVVAIFVLFNLGAPLIAILAVAAIVYGGYRLMRAIILAGESRHAPRRSRPTPPVAKAARQGVRPYPAPPAQTPTPRTAPAQAQRAAARHVHRQNVQARRQRRHSERAMRALPIKSTRQHATELVGSLLLAAGVALAITVVMTLIAGGTQPQQFAWLALVGVAGSWGVLIPAKFWEGTRGEPVLRRFVMLVMGLLLGLLAGAAAAVLFVDLPYADSLMVDPRPLVMEIDRDALSYFGPAGQPLLPSFVAFFGFLFPMLRWWRQADPLRNARLSLWATGVCTGWAMLLSIFWGFPQPWGMMVAATISISVQLASPWIDPRRRMKRSLAAAQV
jgi:hypothetical protein